MPHHLPPHTNAQRHQLLNMYIQQYNRINNQIERLMSSLDTVRDCMNQLVFPEFERNNNSPIPINNLEEFQLHIHVPNPNPGPGPVPVPEFRELLFRDIENPINDTCPITMELFRPDELVSQLNYCKHIFIQSHFQTWISMRSTCPLCRHAVNH
jgi:hypothetical protein